MRSLPTRNIKEKPSETQRFCRVLDCCRANFWFAHDGYKLNEVGLTQF